MGNIGPMSCMPVGQGIQVPLHRHGSVSILSFPIKMPTMSLHTFASAMLVICGCISRTYAAPYVRSATLVESTQDGRINIWISNVAPTILGLDATDFDYSINESARDTITESVNAYANAVSSGSQDDIVETFLNVTMGGFMTPAQANDMKWKCNELCYDQAITLTACDGLLEYDFVPRPVSGLVEQP